MQNIRGFYKLKIILRKVRSPYWTGEIIFQGRLLLNVILLYLLVRSYKKK